MKYIEVTAWGNGKKHLVPLNKVVDFSFEDKYTTLSLSGGRTLNVIEDESVIKDMLSYHRVDMIDPDQLEILAMQNEIVYENMSQLYMADDDELPF